MTHDMTHHTGNFRTRVAAAMALLMPALIAPTACADRTLTHEAVIDAPVAEVWRMFTTDEGASAWMAPKVKVDLRVGGSIRASYHPESTLDDEHTIVNRILAYEPLRMIALRNERAPSDFPWKEHFQQTWSVSYFEPLGEQRTRLRLVGLGYGTGPEWDQLHDFFERGNQQVLDALSGHFGGVDDNSADRVLETLHTLLGSEWIHESESANGSVFRSRSIVEAGADGKSLVTRGWIGNAHGMHDHGRTLIYRAAKSDGGGIRFVNVDEQGSIAQGEIRLMAEAHLHWDWPLTALDGSVRRYSVDMRFDGEDAYVFTLSSEQADGTWKRHNDVRFTRVARVPGSSGAQS